MLYKSLQIIIFSIIFTISSWNCCFAEENSYINTPTKFNIVESIICEDNNFEPIYNYIIEYIDKDFYRDDYLVDESNIKTSGKLYLNHIFNGKETGIRYEIDFLNNSVLQISRLGKVNYDAESILAYNISDKTYSPFIDGLKAFKKNIVLDIDDDFVRNENGEKIENFGLYFNQSNYAMAPLRGLSEFLGMNNLVNWNEENSTVSVGETDKRLKRKSSYISSFILDTNEKTICAERNNEAFLIQLNEHEIENVNGTIFVSVEKLLNAFGIDDKMIEWNHSINGFIIDLTPNFDTDRITICEWDYKNSGEPYFVRITDSSIIERFKELCISDSFRSVDYTTSKYQGDPDFYIDFNNGTVIRYYSENDNLGYFYDYMYIPKGVVEYASSFVR